MKLRSLIQNTRLLIAEAIHSTAPPPAGPPPVAAAGASDNPSQTGGLSGAGLLPELMTRGGGSRLSLQPSPASTPSVLAAETHAMLQADAALSRLPTGDSSDPKATPAVASRARDGTGKLEPLVKGLGISDTAFVGTSLSMGYAVWLIRGGSQLTAFPSALPAWQAFDRLPIPDHSNAGRKTTPTP